MFKPGYRFGYCIGTRVNSDTEPFSSLFGKTKISQMDKEEVNKLLKKLNYRGQKRIAVLNTGSEFCKALEDSVEGLRIDTEIDPRFPYDFILVFVQYVKEIEHFAAPAIHNLTADGVLWFAFPKKSSKKLSSDVDPDHGWEFLTGRGLDKVRQINVNGTWSAIRFRNVRFIRSRVAKSS